MEYLRDRGSHADVPVAEIMQAFREVYPVLVQSGREAAGGMGAAARAGDPEERFG